MREDLESEFGKNGGIGKWDSHFINKSSHANRGRGDEIEGQI